MDEQTFHTRMNIFIDDRRKSVEWLCGSPWTLFVALSAIIWTLLTTLDGTTPIRALLFHALTILFILIIPLSLLATSLLSATTVLPEGRVTTTSIIYKKQFALNVASLVIVILALSIGILNYKNLPSWYNWLYTIIYSILIINTLWMFIPRSPIDVPSNPRFERIIKIAIAACLFPFGVLHCFGSYKIIQLIPISSKYIAFILSFNGLMICFWLVALASQSLHEIKMLRKIRDYGVLNKESWEDIYSSACNYLFGRKI